MSKNKLVDMWMMIPRGERRVLLLLLCVLAALGMVRWMFSTERQEGRDATADYSVLEQEITDFRSQLDTIPPDERRPTYRRRTNVEPDSTIDQQAAKKRKMSNKKTHTPRPIETMQRVEETSK